jgi:hypothetical protein
MEQTIDLDGPIFGSVVAPESYVDFLHSIVIELVWSLIKRQRLSEFRVIPAIQEKILSNCWFHAPLTKFADTYPIVVTSELSELDLASGVVLDERMLERVRLVRSETLREPHFRLEKSQAKELDFPDRSSLYRCVKRRRTEKA